MCVCVCVCGVNGVCLNLLGGGVRLMVSVRVCVGGGEGGGEPKQRKECGIENYISEATYIPFIINKDWGSR